MAEKNKHPSLPPNYVSILELRERWLREQQQKKEQEEQEQGRHQQQVGEKKKDYPKTEEVLKRCEELDSISIIRRPHWTNRNRYNRRRVEVGRPKTDEAEAEGEGKAEAKMEAKAEGEAEAVVVAGEGIGEEERDSVDDSKKKKPWKKKKGKYKREEEAIRGTETALGPGILGEEKLPEPEILEEEKLPARKFRARRDDVKRGMEQWRPKGGKVVDENEVLKDKHAKSEDGPVVEIGQKFENFSVNRGKEEGKEWSRFGRFAGDGGGGRYRSSGRFGGGSYSRGPWRPRSSSGWVWVQKIADYFGHLLVILLTIFICILLGWGQIDKN